MKPTATEYTRRMEQNERKLTQTGLAGGYVSRAGERRKREGDDGISSDNCHMPCEMGSEGVGTTKHT
jgi:hypothetical protein